MNHLTTRWKMMEEGYDYCGDDYSSSPMVFAEDALGMFTCPKEGRHVTPVDNDTATTCHFSSGEVWLKEWDHTGNHVVRVIAGFTIIKPIRECELIEWSGQFLDKYDVASLEAAGHWIGDSEI